MLSIGGQIVSVQPSRLPHKSSRDQDRDGIGVWLAARRLHRGKFVCLRQIVNAMGSKERPLHFATAQS